MACKQVIVLPPEIPMVFPSPTEIRGFLHDMVPAMREVIAATLSTEFEDDIIYILQSFIQFILAQWSWKKYYRKFHKKEKEAFLTWFLIWLRKYLSDNRATLGWFDDPSWLRQDNSMLITVVQPKELYYLPPPRPDAEVEPVLLHTFDELTTGVAELAPTPSSCSPPMRTRRTRITCTVCICGVDAAGETRVDLHLPQGDDRVALDVVASFVGFTMIVDHCRPVRSGRDRAPRVAVSRVSSHTSASTIASPPDLIGPQHSDVPARESSLRNRPE
jgi:hypothetical protein